LYCVAHVARARLRDRHQDNLRKKLEVLKAQQRVEESQFDPEEGNSGRISCEQVSKITGPMGHNEPSTSKNVPIKKLESQSSTEDDIR